MFRYLFQFKKTLLITGDIVIFYIAIVSTLIIRYGGAFDKKMLINHLVYFTPVLMAALLVFYINSLYNFKKTKNHPSFYLSLLKSVLLIFLASSAYFYFTASVIAPKTNLFIFSLALLALLFLWRYCYNILLKSPQLQKETIIIGNEKRETTLENEIRHHPEFGYKIKTSVDPSNTASIKNILKDLPPANGETVIVGSSAYNDQTLTKILYSYRHPAREYIRIQEFYEKIIQKIPMFAINEIWFLENISEQKLLYDILKRALDLAAGAAMIAIFFIAFIPMAIIIKIDSSGPLFFRQLRVGKNGKKFTLLKFRSMINGPKENESLWTEKNDLRITKVGKFLRQTRLDELPQLINIIKGEMSFIGPRPERTEMQEEFKKQIPFYEERNLIKPGLTGWAQVKYRYTTNAEDTAEKLQYDLYYVKNRSLSLDLDIILKTINIVLERKGQ